METAAELERAEGSIKVRPASSLQHKGDSLRLVETLGIPENFIGNDLEFQPLILGRHTDDFAAVSGCPKLLQQRLRKGHRRKVTSNVQHSDARKGANRGT